MNKKVLIVEDQFVEANDLQLMLVKAGYEVCGIARTVATALEIVKKEKPGLVLVDIFLKGKLTGIDLAVRLKEDNIAFIYLSANSNEDVLNAAKTTQPYGFLIKPFREKDLLITLEIARYRHEHSVESYFKRENNLKDKLAAIIVDRQNWEEKLLNIGKTIQPNTPFDYMAAGFNKSDNMASQAMSLLRIGYDEYQRIGVSELVTITGLNKNEIVRLANNTSYKDEPAVFNEVAFEQLCARPSLSKLFSDAFQMRSCISLPLRLANGEDFIFCFYSKKADTYNTDHVGSLKRLQEILTKGIERMLLIVKDVKINASKSETDIKNQSNYPPTAGFEGIIGRSHLLLNVFDLITQVAPSDASVLI
ncbi:MAG TPA: response regulator, partial [Chlamydiales bacterium]|nr:response regulator [Chlamydiales bacterium]